MSHLVCDCFFLQWLVVTVVIIWSCAVLVAVISCCRCCHFCCNGWLLWLLVVVTCCGCLWQSLAVAACCGHLLWSMFLECCSQCLLHVAVDVCPHVAFDVMACCSQWLLWLLVVTCYGLWLLLYHQLLQSLGGFCSHWHWLQLWSWLVVTIAWLFPVVHCGHWLLWSLLSLL